VQRLSQVAQQARFAAMQPAVSAPQTRPVVVRPRFCKDCKHSVVPPKNVRGMRCSHPAHGVDLVFGRPILPACEALRNDPWCGEDGRRFEARLASTAIAEPGIDTVANGAQGV